ncbi:flavodoxin [Arenibacter sp. GZD96]|uniref:flavodoxin n=1 Tax=Aurantibrevibacter litoralis TaxID=3106030 RepID=UPI002AFDD9E5|nr:flavodoxin [Arenibacter sp. GZD-96]MEA1784674.1 flavodoxin [Arenibacter sp. GZD-96]
MRKLVFLFLIVFSSLPLWSMFSPGQLEEKVLIVYLSRTNNTKAVAQMIYEHIGGTLVALELESSYPENYKAIVAQVAKENETGYLPPLKTKIQKMDGYKVVFVGFPTWGMQLPPPVKSFLSTYDLSGKKVVPFNSNAGYGLGNSIKTLKEMCPNSTVLTAFSTRGGIERDGVYFVIKDEKEKQVRDEVKRWLSGLGLLSE